MLYPALDCFTHSNTQSGTLTISIVALANLQICAPTMPLMPLGVTQVWVMTNNYRSMVESRKSVLGRAVPVVAAASCALSVVGIACACYCPHSGRVCRLCSTEPQLVFGTTAVVHTHIYVLACRAASACRNLISHHRPSCHSMSHVVNVTCWWSIL